MALWSAQTFGAALRFVAATRKARLMWADVEGSDIDIADSRWPNIKPWSIGVWLEDATLMIPVPEQFDV